MSNLLQETILSVHHWNDSLFTFRTTRDPGLRFANGQFVMIGGWAGRLHRSTASRTPFLRSPRPSHTDRHV